MDFVPPWAHTRKVAQLRSPQPFHFAPCPNFRRHLFLTRMQELAWVIAFPK